jgi:integrase/recombinase XerC
LILTLDVEGWDPMASLRKRGAHWYIRYRDANGKQTEVKAGPDKGVAKTIANRIESQVRAVKTGTMDPREAGWADAERKPLTDHVNDWHSVLIARGRVRRYAEMAREKVLRLIDLISAQRISQITLSAVEIAVGELRSIRGRYGNEGLSDQTVVHHVRAIKSFTKWLRTDGRVRLDPLADLSPPKVVTKRVRKPLSPEDAARLIEVTRTRKPRCGLAGEDRAALYAMALGTGLRLSELLSLTPEDLRLDSDPPTIRCRAQFTKNRREAVQPIRPELADYLRPWVASKAPGKAMMPHPGEHASYMVRGDLKAAGVAQWAEYDFHCLRHSYITTLILSGANAKAVQVLARHHDLRLTLGTYTHTTIQELAHTLPTLGVSPGLNGSHTNPEKDCPNAIHEDLRTPASQYIALMLKLK